MKNIAILGCCRSGHNFVMEQIKSWNIKALIYNFEDVKPEYYAKHSKTMVWDGKIFNAKYETINIIVVRDLLNWWASYLKWITKDGIDSYLCTEEKLQNAFDIWLDIAKEGLNETNYIKNKHLTVFNSFTKSLEVRELICEMLGGVYNENLIDLVVGAGGGSSFDGQKITGSKMKTNTRYKQILNTKLNDLYLKMLRKNTESINFYKKHLLKTKDQEAFLKVL